MPSVGHHSIVSIDRASSICVRFLGSATKTISPTSIVVSLTTEDWAIPIPWQDFCNPVIGAGAIRMSGGHVNLALVTVLGEPTSLAQLSLFEVHVLAYSTHPIADTAHFLP